MLRTRTVSILMPQSACISITLPPCLESADLLMKPTLSYVRESLRVFLEASGMLNLSGMNLRRFGLLRASAFSKTETQTLRFFQMTLTDAPSTLIRFSSVYLATEAKKKISLLLKQSTQQSPPDAPILTLRNMGRRWRRR